MKIIYNLPNLQHIFIWQKVPFGKKPAVYLSGVAAGFPAAGLLVAGRSLLFRLFNRWHD